jgi:RNA polymerase sigma-70 factor (ECF subfamily)
MGSESVKRDDEYELLARARAGERRAFSILAERHQHQVFTLALRLAGDRDLAADISQEALLRAWRGIGSFRGDARFSSWLYRITVNVAWTQLDRRRRTQNSPLEAVENMAAPLSSYDNPEMALETANLRGRLRRALLRLPQRARVVVVLRDVYNWSHAQIAEALGISVSASKVRLHRARKRLRTMLENAP